LFRNAAEKFRKLQTFTWRINELNWGIQGLLFALLEVGIMYYALQLWKQGLLTIGDFALIQGFIAILFNQLWDIGRNIRDAYEAYADAKEMVEVLEEPHEIRDLKRAKKLKIRRGKIEFKDIDFAYPHSNNVFSNFSLTIKPNERVAFVGYSGVGKSTITSLLFRFFDIQRGQILIDGQNTKRVTQESLRQSIAMVPQEAILFHRSILENIRYGKRDATDEDVIDAAKKAHCHDFILSLPNGYDTLVGERGIKLSGGERQRIAIARAILKDAPILVLDEATSSLDSESESLIQDALERLMKGRTTIVIAHRLSTILKMDRIVVLENGQVIDEGSHAQLSKKRGIYKKLWDIQVGGFIQ